MTSPSRPAPWRLFLLNNQYPALHGLRVLAVLAVVQLHVSVSFERWGVLPRGAFYDASTRVWFAMDLFFLLSGFLIGTMLLRDDEPLDPRRVARFYARRSFRIVPPYFIVLTALALLGPLTLAQRAGLWREYLYLTNYVLGRDTPVMVWAWSLCVEEHFYLLVPLVVAALGALRTARARTAALCLAWLSGLSLRVAVIVIDYPHADFFELFGRVYPRTHLRYDILVAGVLAAHLHRRHGAFLADRFARPGWRVAMYAFCLACLALLVAPPTSIPLPLVCAVSWGGLTSALYLPLVLLLVNQPGALGRQLGRRGFLHVATLGYGVYLVHVPIIERLVRPALVWFTLAVWNSLRVLPPLWLLWPLAFALTMVFSLSASYLLHVLVEKPCLALRDRFVPGSG